MSDPLVTKNQQIADLQRELMSLKMAKAGGSPLADQLLAQAEIAKSLAGLVPPMAAPAPVPAVTPAPTVTDVPFVSVSAEVLPEPAAPVAEPVIVQHEVIPPEPTVIEPVPEPPKQILTPPAMTTDTPKEQPRAFLPDVKMLAPILKIALATLSIEQMVEIALHVKQGAPGFKEFMDSDVARAKFRELYGVYCDFLAGKVK